MNETSSEKLIFPMGYNSRDNTVPEFFVCTHEKGEGKDFFVCVSCNDMTTALKKMDDESKAYELMFEMADRAKTTSSLEFNIQAMSEFTSILKNKNLVIEEREIDYRAIAESNKKSVTYTANSAAWNCEECSQFYEPWHMCKVLGGLASNIKSCTCFKPKGGECK